MYSKATSSAFFLASMVFASSAFATDINKCVTASGGVTLTDEVCPSGAQTVKVISAPVDSVAEETASAAPAGRPGIERHTMARMPTHFATLVRSAQPARGLSLDIATLKAARANMRIVDSAAQAMRSQRLASLQ